MTQAKDPGLEVFRPESTPERTTWQSNPSKPLEQAATAAAGDQLLAPDSLYVYSLGIRDIQAKSIQYGDKQAYVTKPLAVPGNVMEVQLEAEENHPLFDDLSGKANPRQTSVEYYLSYKQKPGAADWVPLLPLDQETVVGERLLPDENGECRLRFPARMASINAYANGLSLAPGTVHILAEDRLLLSPFDPGAIYTVDYTPDSYRQDPWTFRLADHKKDVVRVVERFEGTAYNKTVTLKHSPYLDLPRMRGETDYDPNTADYRPVAVYLKDASLQGENRTLLKEVRPFDPETPEVAHTRNKTLYLDKSWSPLLPYSLEPESAYKGFDYYQWKNKLTFTEHFRVQPLAENLPYTHGNADIEVHYDTLLTDFRLKIIVRRNTGSEQTVTPEVEGYTLRFKTIE